jgi:hypothetical protein
MPGAQAARAASNRKRAPAQKDARAVETEFSVDFCDD